MERIVKPLAPRTKRTKKMSLEVAVKKVRKLYANFGIDAAFMDEEEIVRVAKEYMEYEDLDSDIRNTAEHAGKFSEDEIL